MGQNVVRPEFVTIPVSLTTSDGRPVLGLKSDDFRVALGTTRAEVVSVERRPGPLHVGLVIDASGSAGLVADKTRSAAKLIIENLRPNDKVTVAAVTNKLDILAAATSDRAQLDKAVKNSVKSPGWQGTALYDALEKMVATTPADEPFTALVLITDGVDSASKRASYVSALEAVERSGAHVFSVYFDSESWGGRIQARDLQRPGALSNLSRDLAEANAKEAAKRGREFLEDLSSASGGRRISLLDVGAGKTAELERVPSDLLNQYQLRVRVPAEMREDRLPVTVQVLRPDLVVLAKGSIIF